MSREKILSASLKTITIEIKKIAAIQHGSMLEAFQQEVSFKKIIRGVLKDINNESVSFGRDGKTDQSYIS